MGQIYHLCHNSYSLKNETTCKERVIKECKEVSTSKSVRPLETDIVCIKKSKLKHRYIQSVLPITEFCWYFDLNEPRLSFGTAKLGSIENTCEVVSACAYREKITGSDVTLMSPSYKNLKTGFPSYFVESLYSCFIVLKLKSIDYKA